MKSFIQEIKDIQNQNTNQDKRIEELENSIAMVAVTVEYLACLAEING